MADIECSNHVQTRHLRVDIVKVGKLEKLEGQVRTDNKLCYKSILWLCFLCMCVLYLGGAWRGSV